MTFGVSRDQGQFEWAGTSLAAVFAQRKNIFSFRVWRMIFDIIRFNQFALDLLKEEHKSEVYMNGDGKGYHEAEKQETIGQYLAREGYSDAFRDDYLIPMTAAVWSTSPDKCSLEFPAVTLVRFMYVLYQSHRGLTDHHRWNHHLLSTVATRPQWLTLKHGAKSYIDAVMRGFPPNHIYLSTPVTSLHNESDGRVRLTTSTGKTAIYDHVILATHGDTALDIITPSATTPEKKILSGFQTSENTAILHSDLSLMPRRREAWSAWNYITETGLHSSNIDQVCLTYNMNILQHIPTSTFGDVLVTLNPLSLPPPEKVQGRYTYRHPLYNTAAIRSQSLLPQIQNTRGISYCGAWTKYGFHEDAFSSGLKVSIDHLGAKLPFDFTDSTFSRGRKPVLGVADLLLRVFILWVQMWIQLLEGVGRLGQQLRDGGLAEKKKVA
jgi:predicted NAD/FAD-binding protein